MASALDSERRLIGMENFNCLGNIIRSAGHVDAGRVKVRSLIPDVDALGLIRCGVGEESGVRGEGTELVASDSHAFGDKEVPAAELVAACSSRASQQEGEDRKNQHDE